MLNFGKIVANGRFQIWGIFWAASWLFPLTGSADEQPGGLKAAAASAERIVIAVASSNADKTGLIDVAPGGRIAIEVEIELRGTGKKSVLILNGGTAEQHPRYTKGKPYIFLLKRNPQGGGWLNIGSTEISIKNGKVQWVEGGKTTEEIPLPEFEELAAAAMQAVEDKIVKRDSLNGKWVVTRHEKGTDLYLWLVEIQVPEGQEPKVKLLSTNRHIEAASLKSAAITGNDVRLTFSADGTTFDFQGRFADGMIRGTIVGGPSAIAIPARLEPTDLSKLEKKYEDHAPDPLYEEFVQSVSQENPTGALTRFVKRHPNSSLALSAYQSLIVQAAGEQMPRDRFEKLAEEYRALAAKWGPRFELQALADLGTALSIKNHLSELSLEYLEAAHARIDEATSPEVRKSIEIERGRRMIALGKAAEGTALLNQMRSEYPFDPLVLYSLARQAEADGRKDEALEMYGELQILPQLEQTLVDAMKSMGSRLTVDQYPRRQTTRLWIEKHGDGAGLAVWLDELYARRIAALGSNKRPPAEGNRVALCELFTNISSNPSIAADAAVSSLGAAFGDSIVVLRYHVNEPSADPLANFDCQNRFKMYSGTETPLVVLSGRRQFEVAGPLFHTTSVFRRLEREVELTRLEKTDFKITLSAESKDGVVSIQARAAGLDPFPAGVNMGIVIAEDRIHLPAKNGVRIHEMVVRAMPAGPGGVEPRQGVLRYSEEFKPTKLKELLLNQIKEKEASAETRFEHKPLDLSKLHFVAYLQNNETGEVYQATSVPLDGLPNAAGSPEKPRDAKGAGGEKPATEKSADP